MKKVFIISNFLKDHDSKVTERISSILESHGISCKVNCVASHGGNDDGCPETKREQIDKDTDCIMIVGGDGTLIRAARDLAGIDIPMIGVNLGNLGYLAEIEQDDIEEMIEMIMQEKYRIDSRIMLEGEVFRGNREIYHDIALNDIVCARTSRLNVIDFKVFVNDEFLNNYSADGIIISTPTGSTAYNLSAGGPILEPGANIVVITPICTHTLGARSIVLSASSTITIEICQKRHHDDNSAGVYFDGHESHTLEAGDRIRIRRSALETKIMKLNHISFVEVLHKKMNQTGLH